MVTCMRCSQKTCPALCLLKLPCQPGEPKPFLYSVTQTCSWLWPLQHPNVLAKLHCRSTTDASHLPALQEAARQGHCEITLPDPLPDCLDFEVLTLVGLPGALLFHHSKP